MKRRVLKYVLVGTGIVALAGFWAFSTFVFNPFEDDYAYPLSTLIPRDVEFFLSKEDLAQDFDPFPEPAFLDDFLADPRSAAWLEFESTRSLLAELDLEALVAELEAGLAELPVEVDPLSVFGGSELPVAGYFAGPDLAQAEWAVYARVGRLGKLAVEAIHSGLTELPGFEVTAEEDTFRIAGGSLTTPVFVKRLLDVVVVSTRADLVDQVRVFDVGRGENSFGLSAQFNNHKAELDRNDDDLDVYVDQAALLEALQKPGSWPNAHDEELTWAMAGRLFQLGLVRELMTTVSFGKGLTIQASGALSSEFMTPYQKKVYRERGFEKAQVFEMAKMAPDDAGLFLYGHGPMNDILVELIDSLDESTLTIVEDPARNVWGYSDIYPLLADISAVFDDRFAIFLRNLDYPEETSADSPLHDDAIVPAWAIALEVDDAEELERLRSQIRKNPSAFGIRGRDPSKGGVFTNEVSGGGVVYEYHSIAVPGTGHIATIEMFGPSGKKYFLVSNSHQFLGQVFVTYRGGRPNLAEDNWFQTLVNAGLPSADLVAWLNPRAVSATTRAMAKKDAELDVALGIDWARERPPIEDRVLTQNFPGQRRGALSAGDQATYERLVAEAVDAFEQQYVRENLGELEATYARPYIAAELSSGALFEVSVDQKEMQLYGRIVVPFDSADAP